MYRAAGKHLHDSQVDDVDSQSEASDDEAEAVSNPTYENTPAPVAARVSDTISEEPETSSLHHLVIDVP